MLIPQNVAELSDLVVWMIATMPDFVTSTVPNGSPDLAFDTLDKGIAEICDTLSNTVCAESLELSRVAKLELENGDEQASYEALNEIFRKLKHRTP